MILPLRVLGSPEAMCTTSGAAKAPITWRTCSLSEPMIVSSFRAACSADKDQLQGALKEQVRHMIGAFASPDVVHIASGLPKTRSGKIMRRILRKIAASEYDGMGDLTTLAEPEVVDRLIQEHRTGLR